MEFCFFFYLLIIRYLNSDAPVSSPSRVFLVNIQLVLLTKGIGVNLDQFAALYSGAQDSSNTENIFVCTSSYIFDQYAIIFL